LRKTAINMVRQQAGEEVASLFAAHGRPVHDDLIRVYANPRWPVLHATTEAVRLKLEPVFASVPDPFPPEETKGGPNISRGTIETIRRLAAEGKRISEVANGAGVSRETVRRWLQRQ